MRKRVSTSAMSTSPFWREARIWVVITRNEPPKMYGAENEPRAVRKVRIAAAASAGASPGRTTRVSVRQRPAPREAAASSCAPSKRASAARVKR